MVLPDQEPDIRRLYGQTKSPCVSGFTLAVHSVSFFLSFHEKSSRCSWFTRSGNPRLLCSRVELLFMLFHARAYRSWWGEERKASGYLKGSHHTTGGILKDCRWVNLVKSKRYPMLNEPGKFRSSPDASKRVCGRLNAKLCPRKQLRGQEHDGGIYSKAPCSIPASLELDSRLIWTDEYSEPLSFLQPESSCCGGSQGVLKFLHVRPICA